MSETTDVRELRRTLNVDYTQAEQESEKDIQERRTTNMKTVDLSLSCLQIYIVI